MIYQENKTYKFFLFKASYSSNEAYLSDKTNFEKQLLENLQNIENDLAMQEDRQPAIVNLPIIAYTDITHTQAEIDRLALCQSTNGQLDDIKTYVLTGNFPTTDHSLKFLEIQQLKADKVNLQASIDSLNIALANMMGV